VARVTERVDPRALLDELLARHDVQVDMRIRFTKRTDGARASMTPASKSESRPAGEPRTTADQERETAGGGAGENA
jgi:hypothetical protein